MLGTVGQQGSFVPVELDDIILSKIPGKGSPSLCELLKIFILDTVLHAPVVRIIIKGRGAKSALLSMQISRSELPSMAPISVPSFLSFAFLSYGRMADARDSSWFGIHAQGPESRTM